MALRPAGNFPVYFARHGETELNIQRRWQGSRDDSPLTPGGREHARETGLILRDLVSLSAPPRFVASPLGRAKATMEIVLATLGLPAGTFTTDRRLVEIDVGDWSGQLVEHVKATDPRWAARLEDRWNVRCPGGESYADVAARAAHWLDDLRDETVVIAHGAFGRVLRGLSAGATPDEILALDEPHGCVFRLLGGTVAKFSV